MAPFNHAAALLALAASAGALVAPRLHVARPGKASQLAAWKYDMTSVERALDTERDACGVGFIAESKGGPSRRVMEAATNCLCANEHRGGCSADGISGDGSGIMTQIPLGGLRGGHAALKGAARGAPPGERMGCMTLFVPRDPEAAARAKEVVLEAAEATGFEVVAWRDTPVDASVCGVAAELGRPDFAHVFLRTSADTPTRTERNFERALYLYRRSLRGAWDRDEELYVASCSSKTTIYKGMVNAASLKLFYPDLQSEDYVSQFAIYHRRFSTNTMPRWSLAQPFRLIAHNGEINTVRGNVNWMVSRAEAAGGDLGAIAAGCSSEDPDRACEYVDPESLGPVVDASKSDSANLDASLELYTRAGRTVDESLLMMMPPAIPAENEKVFFDLHAPLQEPWDGPASVCFSDGNVIGARLDRNGLRPARITRYRDGLVCLGSESGSYALFPGMPPDSEILERKRLGPGMSCLIDLVANDGGYYDDKAVKARIASNPKWQEALDRQRRFRLDDMDAPAYAVPGDRDLRTQAAFGWGSEDVDMQVTAMVKTGGEATHCMGADAPLAAMSTFAHPAYDYFKQRHAQVTNPPIDPIREKHVMTTETWMGERPNCVDVALGTDDGSNLLVRMDSPVVHAGEVDVLKTELLAETLDTTYDPSQEFLEGGRGENFTRSHRRRRRRRARLVILSDKSFGEGLDSSKRLYVPPLVMTGATHHALIGAGLRLKGSILVETAQVWSTHHVATLCGYGASAVHPYMLFRVAAQLTTPPKEGKKPKIDGVTPAEGVANARAALKTGVLKIMSKIGISALSSYHGAQIFECVGLHPEVVDVAFKGTASRLGGLDFEEMEKEVKSMVNSASYEIDDDDLPVFKLANFGFINALQKGRGGEEHANSPKVAKLLHAAVREDDAAERKIKYDAFAAALREDSPFGLRDLMTLKYAAEPSTAAIPRESIFTRFVTGGISPGALQGRKRVIQVSFNVSALSRETHESLAMAMNRLGAASNSGEGGEDSVRNDKVGDNRDTTWKHLKGKSIRADDTAVSRIRQVASGRFGVTASYLATASQIEIKVAQGAKPGEGGQLPGGKVDAYIASIRAATEGVTLISPPPHHDIYSIEDLTQLIFDLKAINPTARISVKLVSIIGIGTLGLAEVHNTLVENGLRDGVTVRADGGVRTGLDVVKLALLGAEEFGFGTVAMVAAGCVMARVCHTNNCPVGVATQKSKLRERVRGEPEDITRYFECVADETADILRSLGLDSLLAAIGRADLLESLDEAAMHALLPKTNRFDVKSTVLKPIDFGPNADGHFDDQYLGEDGPSSEPYAILNTDRAIGTRLAGDIARRRRALGSVQPVEVNYRGSAGQSFAAFAVSEMRVTLEGDANDYVGKGLSGAHVSIFPPKEAVANGDFVAKDSVIIGNTCLYGATSGRFFANGQSGDRFGVRNSGVQAVIEGAGDHCCEYMTNGIVVVLGPTGINIGSGMTGGVAYLYAPDGDDEVAARLNSGNVKGRRIVDAASPAALSLRGLIEDHLEATGSKWAEELLEDFDHTQFVQVVPPSEIDQPKNAVQELAEEEAPVPEPVASR
ncbi:hypothetical protein JL722_206 [Aureococcus anophagefferens]|nr:hypothetical protein JL722_206 [Aureococcus anophagefferens]